MSEHIRLQSRAPFLNKKEPRTAAFFDAESWRIAAVDLVLAEQIAPRAWTPEVRRKVVRLLRQGKSTAEVFQEHPSLQYDTLEKLRKLTRCRTVGELMRYGSSL